MARRVLCNRRSFLTTNVLFQSPVPITATETVFANSASANVTLPTPVNLAMNSLATTIAVLLWIKVVALTVAASVPPLGLVRTALNNVALMTARLTVIAIPLPSLALAKNFGLVITALLPSTEPALISLLKTFASVKSSAVGALMLLLMTLKVEAAKKVARLVPPTASARTGITPTDEKSVCSSSLLLSLVSSV
jgi:hypothetical protein